VNRTLATVLTFLATTSAVHAANPEQANLVKATLLADVERIAPGAEFTVGVRLKIKSHWHVYWVNPGETGDATRVKLTGPAGLEFGPTQYPVPTKIENNMGLAYGYEDEVLLLVPVKVSKDFAAGGEVKIQADVKWLSCKDTCIEGSAQPRITLTVAAATKPENKELFAAWRARLPIPASPAVASVKQSADPGGAPLPEIAVDWKDAAPAKVDFYPLSTRAVAIENVSVKQEGRQTKIRFKPTVYKPEQVPGGRVEGLLVIEDAAGGRQGVTVSFAVATKKE
jgi:DsbC/DsbD-like thiol-disulfide interchange protein